ncbi:hypothetical protein REPUB_Repub02eG0052900 [Reevesia pubescens]
MDPDIVAKVFVEHYYSTFDAIQAGLANLYQDGSMLTFEGQKIQGSQNFMAMLTGLPFQQCQHNISTIDCQPSGADGMLVFVFGTLQLADEQHALKFSKANLCFMLMSSMISVDSFHGCDLVLLDFSKDLSENELIGHVLLILGDLSYSGKLYLHGNKLTGPIPPELAICQNLATFSVEEIGGSRVTVVRSEESGN